MPTYTVYATQGELTDRQKEALAAGITQTHSSVTGAQGFFAQVLFVDVDPRNWFMGGKRLATKQIYCTGTVRGGRPAEMKSRLLTALRDVVIDASGLFGSSVWVYLDELPPAQMIEYGHVLPEPGEEMAWLEDMPPADRAFMEGIGR